MVTDFRKGTSCIGKIALSWENFVSIYFEFKRLEIQMHKSFTSVVHCGVGISCDFIDLLWFSLKRHTSFRMWILVWVVFWDRKRELSPHKRIPQQAKREALPCLRVGCPCSPHGHPTHLCGPVAAVWPGCCPGGPRWCDCPASEGTGCSSFRKVCCILLQTSQGPAPL